MMTADSFDTNPQPRFEFSVTDTGHTVDEKSELWGRHLPASRHIDAPDRSPATLGHYFTAARQFLSADDYSVVKKSALDLRKNRIESKDITSISICLVKHGTFYHPSRADIRLKDHDRLALVLNLAVSPEGRFCIDREFAALTRLAERTDALPSVYGNAHFSLEDGIDVSVFAAEWLDGYHEFHISRDGDERKIIVWDESNGHCFLSGQQSDLLYRKASRIMSDCYNPVTCEQIQPWHHAAGDFVVKKEGESLDVKLITVRQYTSLFQEIPDDDDSLIEAALIFLINLSIRMRLDREDGIKDIVWADDRCVPQVVNGFLEGFGPKNPAMTSRFLSIASEMTVDQWTDFAHLVIQSYHPGAPELPVIRDHLDRHIHALVGEMKLRMS